MNKKRRQLLGLEIPAWRTNLLLVLSLGLLTTIILEVFSRDRVKADGAAAKIPLDKTAPKLPALPLPKVKLPAKEERIRLATDRVLTNFGIRLDWIKYHGNDRDVRVPKEVHPLVIYQVLSNQVRHLGGKVESGTEDLRTGETTLTYSFAGNMLGKIRLIPDPRLTRHAGKIAIIIDDLGYTTGEVVTGLLKLKIPITYSIIPGVKFSKEIAERLHQAGKPVMIHLPMQALERQVENNGFSILLELKEPEIRERVRNAIKAVPHATGLNNHMGSAATVRDTLMTPVLDELKKAGLFFVDSRTNPDTRAFKLAKRMGVNAQINDLFLDSIEGEEHAQQKMWQLADLAAARGQAIAIGHPHHNTLQAIREIGPQLQQRGFDFVPVEELLRHTAPAEKVLAQRAP